MYELACRALSSAVPKSIGRAWEGVNETAGGARGVGGTALASGPEPRGSSAARYCGGLPGGRKPMRPSLASFLKMRRAWISWMGEILMMDCTDVLPLMRLST